jgi:hypothetical protein
MRRIFELVLATVAAVLAGCGRPAPCGDPATDRKAADCVAWLTFAQVNQRAAIGSNDSQWERWAEATDVFNVKGPVWPGNGPVKKRLRPLKQDAKLANKTLPRPLNGDDSEIRMNRATFDFIQSNAYWNQEGLNAIYRDGVDFPKESVELKAVWEDDADGAGAQRGEYHWQRGDGGNGAIRLTGLHMTSKVIPNWLWATWKHESTQDDPSDDRFGYPSGKRSPELEKFFAYYHVPREWLHYRLIGTQTEFVDAKGVPQKLGNSKIELEAARSSSCITCHALARVSEQGYIFEGNKPCCAAGCCGCIAGSLTGAPAPTSFEGMRQLDFVWSFVEINGPYTQHCP